MRHTLIFFKYIFSIFIFIFYSQALATFCHDDKVNLKIYFYMPPFSKLVIMQVNGKKYFCEVSSHTGDLNPVIYNFNCPPVDPNVKLSHNYRYYSKSNRLTGITTQLLPNKQLFLPENVINAKRIEGEVMEYGNGKVDAECSSSKDKGQKELELENSFEVKYGQTENSENEAIEDLSCANSSNLEVGIDQLKIFELAVDVLRYYFFSPRKRIEYQVLAKDTVFVAALKRLESEAIILEALDKNKMKFNVTAGVLTLATLTKYRSVLKYAKGVMARVVPLNPVAQVVDEKCLGVSSSLIHSIHNKKRPLTEGQVLCIKSLGKALSMKDSVDKFYPENIFEDI